MKFKLYYSFLSFTLFQLGTISALDSRCDNHGSCRVTEALFNNYSSAFRPVFDLNKQLVVNITPTLSWIIKVDEVNQQLTYREWLPMLWFDEYLTWNKEDFEGTEKFSVKATDLWLPDIEPLNANEINYIMPKSSMNAELQPNGRVTVGFVKEVTIRCEFNFDDFPFDNQTCYIDYGSMGLRGLKIVDINPIVQLRILSTHPEWKLTQTMENPAYIQIEYELMEGAGKQKVEILRYTIQMERHAAFYIHTMIVPSFLVTMLTFVALFTPSVETGSRETKVAFGLAAFLTLVIMLQTVTSNVSKSGTRLPLLATFLITQIGITVLATVVATVITLLNEKAFVYKWKMFGKGKKADEQKTKSDAEHGHKNKHKSHKLEQMNGHFASEIQQSLQAIQQWLEKKKTDEAEAEAVSTFWLKLFDWCDIVCLVIFFIANTIILLVMIVFH